MSMAGVDHLLLAIFKPAALVVISDRDIDINTSEHHSLLVDFFSLLSTVTHYVLQNAYYEEKDKEKMMLPMTTLLFFWLIVASMSTKYVDDR